jgi:hypothetical protein
MGPEALLISDEDTRSSNPERRVPNDQLLKYLPVASHGVAEGFPNLIVIELRDPQEFSHLPIIILCPPSFCSCSPAISPEPTYTGHGHGLTIKQLEPPGSLINKILSTYEYSNPRNLTAEERRAEHTALVKAYLDHVGKLFHTILTFLHLNNRPEDIMETLLSGFEDNDPGDEQENGNSYEDLY